MPWTSFFPDKTENAFCDQLVPFPGMMMEMRSFKSLRKILKGLPFSADRFCWPVLSRISCIASFTILYVNLSCFISSIAFRSNTLVDILKTRIEVMYIHQRWSCTNCTIKIAFKLINIWRILFHFSINEATKFSQKSFRQKCNLRNKCSTYHSAYSKSPKKLTIIFQS